MTEQTPPWKYFPKGPFQTDDAPRIVIRQWTDGQMDSMQENAPEILEYVAAGNTILPEGGA